MNTDEPEGNRPVEIPDHAIIVKQSSWAWLVYAVPWVVFAIASIYFDQVTFGIWLWVIAAFLVVPRYLSHRRTAYVLTDEHIVIQRGGIAGHQRYDLPISQVGEVWVNPGLLGRTLGYVSVYLVLRDERVAILHHIPERSPLVEHVRARMDPSTPDEGDTGA